MVEWHRTDGQVLHYPVVSSGDDGALSVRGDCRRRSFLTVGELVEYFRRNRGRLATRLRRPLSEARWPPQLKMAAGDRYRKSIVEIRRADLQLSGESRGRDEEFGMVCVGTYSDGTQTIEVSSSRIPAYAAASTSFCMRYKLDVNSGVP